MSKANEKTYTMQEMADILGVNKTSVFRFLKKEGIAPATIKSNTNFYNATTMQRLKIHFNSSDNKAKSNKSSHELLIETLQQQVRSLQETLSAERNRNDKALNAKDKQIDELNNRLRESHQLQLGLQEKLKMLPEHDDKQIVDGDTSNNSSAINTTENENTVKQKSPKKGLLHRIFG